MSRCAVAQKLLDEVSSTAVLDVFAQAGAGWAILELSREVAERAEGPFPVEPVRTLDALHLASALLLRQALPDLRILSTDDRVRSNGRGLGFEDLFAAARQRGLDGRSILFFLFLGRLGLDLLRQRRFGRLFVKGEQVIANLDLVVVLEQGARGDFLVVDERTVAAPKILDGHPVALDPERRTRIYCRQEAKKKRMRAALESLLRARKLDSTLPAPGEPRPAEALAPTGRVPLA